MYDRLPAFVLGFHGCDERVANDVVSGKTTLEASRNNYDWLGSGVYFWENNPSRAWDYACSLKALPRRARRPVQTPAVIGAVIDLGCCLNLLDTDSIKLVEDGFKQLCAAFETAGKRRPKNRSVGRSKELLLRPLDCAVIELVHNLRERAQSQRFDSVRAAFIEGKPLYPNGGFHSRTHIQICVRTPACIKGYFHVPSFRQGMMTAAE